MRDRPWWEEKLICWDLETTGPDPLTARVVSAAIAIVRPDGSVEDVRTTLCNPGIPIPAEATAIHGIDDAAVVGARPDTMALTGLVRWVARTSAGVLPALTYNGFHYDRQIVQRLTGLKLSDAWEAVPEVDVLALIRTRKIGHFWKGQGRHRLGAVAERLGVTAEGSLHNSGVDAVLTGRIFLAIMNDPAYGKAMRRYLDWDPVALRNQMYDLHAEHERDYQAWKAKQPAQPVNGGGDA